MADDRPAAIAAAYDVDEAHDRSLEFIHTQAEDADRARLAATRVFVSAIWLDLTAARTSTMGIEPFTFRPIVPVPVRRPKYNAAGMRTAEDVFAAVEAGPEYMVFPGQLAPIVSHEAVPAVEVECLRGIEFGPGKDGAALVTALNRLCFPSRLRPRTGPNWLDLQDPRHQDLFRTFEAHLDDIRARHRQGSAEHGAADAAIRAIAKARTRYLGHFGELARQANADGAPVPIDPRSFDNLWLRHLSMKLPAWAVQFDAVAESQPKPATPEAEALLALVGEMRADRDARVAAPAADDPAAVLEHPAVRAVLEAKEKENRALVERLEKLEKKVK